MPAALAPLALHRLDAPAHWEVIECLSDVHLQAEAPRTFEAWRMQMLGGDADALFILGDLFEAWVGDDSRDGDFEHACAEVLREASALRTVAFMHGNRDFMVGDTMLAHCGMRSLPDATVLHAFGRRTVLTHGDALCLADTDYMRFRSQVRNAAWQRDFLSRPLAERKRTGKALREQSEARKSAGIAYAEVDAAAASAWLEAADAQVMIHGHTHRPADHVLDAAHGRTVLSDWDARAQPPRQQVLRLTAAGPQRVAFD